MDQGKLSWRERIPKSSCATKETVDIDIIIISIKGEKKIMQPI